MHDKSKGFSLVETLVAMTVFSFIMLIAVGSVMSIIGANRMARNQKLVLDNVTSAVETMSRNLRQGNSYVIADTGPAVGTRITFDPAGSIPTMYYRYDSVEKRIVRSKNNGPEESLTSPNVEITSLQFRDVSLGQLRYPKVMIVVEGYAQNSTDEASRYTFSLQTTVAEHIKVIGIDEGLQVTEL